MLDPKVDCVLLPLSWPPYDQEKRLIRCCLSAAKLGCGHTPSSGNVGSSCQCVTSCIITIDDTQFFSNQSPMTTPRDLSFLILPISGFSQQRCKIIFPLLIFMIIVKIKSPVIRESMVTCRWFFQRSR